LGYKVYGGKGFRDAMRFVSILPTSCDSGQVPEVCLRVTEFNLAAIIRQVSTSIRDPLAIER
jgi:hypothetical protein